MIDLRSDTATKPPPEMLAAMAAAEVGDEQEQEDPTVNELQRRAAELLGHERRSSCRRRRWRTRSPSASSPAPGGQLIAEERTHILIFEAGGPAVHSGLIARPLPGTPGGSRPARSARRLRPPTGSSRRGSSSSSRRTAAPAAGCGRSASWPTRSPPPASSVCAVHLDGARLMNASVACGVPPADYGRLADTVRSASRRVSAVRWARSWPARRTDRAGLAAEVPVRRRAAAGGRRRGRDALRARPQRRTARGDHARAKRLAQGLRRRAARRRRGDRDQLRRDRCRLDRRRRRRGAGAYRAPRAFASASSGRASSASPPISASPTRTSTARSS